MVFIYNDPEAMHDCYTAHYDPSKEEMGHPGMKTA